MNERPVVMRFFVRALLALACLFIAALAFPMQVRLENQPSIFVILHDHAVGDTLAHFLRIAVPIGAILSCAIALFWSRNGWGDRSS